MNDSPDQNAPSDHSEHTFQERGPTMDTDRRVVLSFKDGTSLATTSPFRIRRRAVQSQIVHDYCIFIHRALVALTRIEMTSILLRSLKNGRRRVLSVHKAYYMYL